MCTPSKTELQTPRSAAEFRNWVDEVVEKLGPTAEGRKKIRFRKGIVKPLVEESLPIGLLCDKFFNRDPRVTVTHILGNQNYDAVIEDRRGAQVGVRYLEITQAHEGENDHLRMVALDEHGRVSVLGTVRKSGTKRTGLSVEVKNEAKLHSEILAEELDRIQKAIERKAGKHYPSGTGLLIVFSDHIACRTDEDISQLHFLLREQAQEANLSQFCWIGAIGWSGNVLVQIDGTAI